jgi:hypothetical protein
MAISKTTKIYSNMETTVFYVAVAYNGGIFNPTVVEKFDNKTDADSYAALMCRSKQRRYIVLEQVTEWDGTPQENA